MLICKIFVNEKEIDEIKIKRTGDFITKNSWHRYKIVKPMGHESHIILHKYSDGHRVLLANALKCIKEKQMLIYEQLLDYANRIKKMIDTHPDKIAEINMGLAQTIRLEYLEDWVNRLEKEFLKGGE